MVRERTGCYNCSQRRIKCDQTRPHCDKCVRKGLACPGYGIRYRFNNGIASRGKFKGCVSPVEQYEKQTATLKEAKIAETSWSADTIYENASPSGFGSLIYVTGSEVEADTPSLYLLRGEQKSGSQQLQPMSSEPCTIRECPSQWWRHDWHTIQASQSRIIDLKNDDVDFSGESDIFTVMKETNNNKDVRLSMAIPSQHDKVGKLQLWDLDVPPSLQVISGMDEGMVEYFSKAIAPVMVVLDGAFNGYRNLILPLAWEDKLVRASVSTVSMYHLSARKPELRICADLSFQSIIQELRRRTSLTGSLIGISAWTTLIILLTGETVSGSNRLPSLFKLLQHLADANKQSGRASLMNTFLAEQTRMMTLFAQPLLDEKGGINILHSRADTYFDFITSAAVLHPERRSILEVIKSAIHRACNIYLVRATKGPPHAETIEDLEALRVLCDSIVPDEQGHHTLVWVYFIAAAESCTLRHREFFTTRLQEIFSRTRFHNIPAAIRALQEFWKVQTERKWTELLPDVMPVFII